MDGFFRNSNSISPKQSETFAIVGIQGRVIMDAKAYKLMLGLWMQANADPYAHLPKHLTSGQLATALSLPLEGG
jgi:hypothetical protein